MRTANAQPRKARDTETDLNIQTPSIRLCAIDDLITERDPDDNRDTCTAPGLRTVRSYSHSWMTTAFPAQHPVSGSTGPGDQQLTDAQPATVA